MTSSAPEPGVAAGVLVGGRSTRMGEPKQLVRIAGTTMVERVVAAFRPHAAEVVLLGDGVVPPSCSGLRRLPDAPGVEGPLGGILAALRSTPPRAWIVAACDMPLLTSDVFDWLLAQRRPGGVAVVPLDSRGRPEPLLAVFEAACLPLVETLSRSASPAPRRLASLPGVATPTLPAELERRVFNVNSPESLHSVASALVPPPGSGQGD